VEKKVLVGGASSLGRGSRKKGKEPPLCFPGGVLDPGTAQIAAKQCMGRSVGDP